MSVGAVSGARLLAVAYADPATAERALLALMELADGGALSIEDAVVVSRKAGGGADVKDHEGRRLAVGEGIVGGGAIGLLLGLVVGLPVAVAVLGAAGGAGASTLVKGIPRSELRRVADGLEPHAAAVIALVDHPDWPRIRAGLAPYGGELIASDAAGDVVEGLAAVDP
jgi:uncharacterized membrane protein